MFNYEIEYVNRYGHVVYSFTCECKTDKQAITKAKKVKQEKMLYPETSWIEIICFDTGKRIYA